jgi:hypothetical protein
MFFMEKEFNRHDFIFNHTRKIRSRLRNIFFIQFYFELLDQSQAILRFKISFFRFM